MKFLDLFILFVFLVLLFLGGYVLWINLPYGETEYKEIKPPINFSKASNTLQFYPNMRYRDRSISYSISKKCSFKKINDIKQSLRIISQKTYLIFFEDEKNSEIKFFCSNISPNTKEEGHFIAGEGGPSEIINTTKYAVILSGKVSLFRNNECENPNIAIHEVLHALGFDHIRDPKSIMYPITRCDQIFDEEIINVINELYKIESAPDLIIEKVSLNKTGRYLNFQIVISNIGLKDVKESRLRILADNKLVKDFEEIGEIDIGTKKIFTVKNLRVPLSSKKFSFIIETFEPELDNKNNKLEITV